jgi:hypothetical protein
VFPLLRHHVLLLSRQILKPNFKPVHMRTRMERSLQAEVWEVRKNFKVQAHNPHNPRNPLQNGAVWVL